MRGRGLCLSLLMRNPTSDDGVYATGPACVLLPLLGIYIAGTITLQGFNLVYLQIGDAIGAGDSVALITAVPGIVLGVACFLYGSLGDFIPLRRIVDAGAVLIAAGSLLGLVASSSLWGVIVARALQILGCQAAASVYMILATSITDPRRRALYVGLMAAAFQGSTAIGLVVGGWLARVNWVLLLLVPLIGLACVPVMGRRVPARSRPGRVDVFGLAVFSCCALTLTVAASNRSWPLLVVLVALIAVFVIAAFQLVFVSFLPAQWGARNPEGIALVGTRLADRLARLSHFADPLLTRVRSSRPAPEPTEAQVRAELISDLREIVDEVGEPESFEEEDRDMVRSVLDLGHTLVREVMVPRTDMVTIDADTPAPSALRLFVRSGFSRVPVVGDDVDDIRGILYFKDLVSRWEATGGQLDMRAEQMMRPAEFAVEMKPADDMLRQMQAERFHMAIVIDEYGGVAGLVTLEDILEEVVGELTDEHDRHSIEPEEVEPGVWRVPARYPISELGELLDREIEDEDVDSVGGLLAKAIGRVPLPGATGTLAGVIMTAEEARGRRRQVSTILCRLDPDAQLLTPDLNPADDKDN